MKYTKKFFAVGISQKVRWRVQGGNSFSFKDSVGWVMFIQSFGGKFSFDTLRKSPDLNLGLWRGLVGWLETSETRWDSCVAVTFFGDKPVTRWTRELLLFTKSWSSLIYWWAISFPNVYKLNFSVIEYLARQKQTLFQWVCCRARQFWNHKTFRPLLSTLFLCLTIPSQEKFLLSFCWKHELFLPQFWFLKVQLVKI